MPPKKIALLGSTGSIGTQALEVISANSEEFQIEVLTANNNANLLIEQSKKYKPNAVVIGEEKHYQFVSDNLKNDFIKVYAGMDALEQIVQMETVDIVLTAMVGFAGLKPTIKAIEAGKPIALANKETLVVAGELITALARNKGVNILPVDSEHSAIFQCLVGEFDNPIEKIYLTASGGPFREKSLEFLEKATLKDALNHPTWNMGDKITIDSASLMNKGLEVIEAKWLFNLKPEQIDVIVHPQSIIHSIVQFCDGSMKAQMGLPDMKLPIQYALGYPKRLLSDFKRFNFLDYPELTFQSPNTKIFRNLALSFEALKKGGNIACILNAANEVAVQLFLEEKIEFLQIAEINEKCMQTVEFIQKPSFEDYLHTDNIARIKAKEIFNKK